MRSYVRTFKCENMNVRSVRNEDCESGYVCSRPYIPICEPEGRDRVEEENGGNPEKENGRNRIGFLSLPSKRLWLWNGNDEVNRVG